MDDRDRATLTLEAHWWKWAGAKEAAIREQFDETPTRFYQRLSVLLDDPEAMAWNPALVKRLVRLRGARRGVRTFGNRAGGGTNG